ncbi:uncharacterized protein LOC121431635 [Lytechinus variegatus]|uniref:uncharacterized protein LOC121431635 n=1 Tax=Lytechinus variegatus TaxID=7654 RepID=UPI001BB1FD11|nr:uncharacterized protein LOC121431635 [Lytechinus variegatus]
MSQQQYHWEALRKQRVIDRQLAVKNKLADEERRMAEMCSEDMAREHLGSRQMDHERRRQLADQIQKRDRQGIRNTYREREQTIQRLVSERTWHDDLIAKMDQKEKDDMLQDLLRDHAQKSKILRDQGLYRGDAKFFIDPQYN